MQDLGELSCLRYVAQLAERVGCLRQGVEGELLRLFDKEWREVVDECLRGRVFLQSLSITPAVGEVEPLGTPCGEGRFPLALG